MILFNRKQFSPRIVCTINKKTCLPYMEGRLRGMAGKERRLAPANIKVSLLKPSFSFWLSSSFW
jgi:hypothetical protein